jgi:hypothetical protein
MTSNKFFKILMVFVCLVSTQLTYAQTDAQPSGPSYKERRDPRLRKSGPLDADPNVYVYTAEFAKRFQMPEEWVSNELKGVDAVAFRVIPRPYKSCGWGGDPNACSSNEVLCEMDLYFDHKRNPLPWDERRPERYSEHYTQSVNFIANYLVESNQNYPRSTQRLRTPPRKDDHVFAKSSPFVDPKSGKGLWWQGGYWNSNEDRGGIYMSVMSYDRELFTGVSLVVMGGGCGQPADAIWLTGDNAGYREKATAFKQISLPQSWRMRAQEATKESKDRTAAFFKQEGEKAMKALREAPSSNKSIVPVQ